MTTRPGPRQHRNRR